MKDKQSMKSWFSFRRLKRIKIKFKLPWSRKKEALASASNDNEMRHVDNQVLSSGDDPTPLNNKDTVQLSAPDVLKSKSLFNPSNSFKTDELASIPDENETVRRSVIKQTVQTANIPIEDISRHRTGHQLMDANEEMFDHHTRCQNETQENDDPRFQIYQSIDVEENAPRSRQSDRRKTSRDSKLKTNRRNSRRTSKPEGLNDDISVTSLTQEPNISMGKFLQNFNFLDVLRVQCRVDEDFVWHPLCLYPETDGGQDEDVAGKRIVKASTKPHVQRIDRDIRGNPRRTPGCVARRMTFLPRLQTNVDRGRKTRDPCVHGNAVKSRKSMTAKNCCCHFSPCHRTRRFFDHDQFCSTHQRFGDFISPLFIPQSYSRYRKHAGIIPCTRDGDLTECIHHHLFQSQKLLGEIDAMLKRANDD